MTRITTVWTQSVRKVALMPPNMVYSTTPTGSRKHPAAVGTPQREVATADPPVKSIAVTRILVMTPNVMYTPCVTGPYLARIASRNV